MLTHLVLAGGVSRDSSWNIYKECRLIYSSIATLLDGACRFFVCFVYFFHVFIFSLVKVFCLRSCFFRFSGRRMPSPADICFRCGKRGHWSSSCGRLSDSPGFGNYRNTTRLGSGITSGEQFRRPDERQSTI